MIEYNPKDAQKIIQINIKSDNDFSFGAYGGLSKDNYFYYSDYNVPNNYFYILHYDISLIDPIYDIDIEENEKYYISLLFSTTQEE